MHLNMQDAELAFTGGSKLSDIRLALQIGITYYGTNCKIHFGTRTKILAPTFTLKCNNYSDPNKFVLKAFLHN